MELNLFLRTLYSRINNIQKNIDSLNTVEGFKTIDPRYSSPVSNPFFNPKNKTIVWIEKGTK